SSVLAFSRPLSGDICALPSFPTRRSSDLIEVGGSGRNVSRGKTPEQGDRKRSSGVLVDRDVSNMPRAELADLIRQLTDQMMQAARDLQFELAARLRDEISELKKELRGMDEAGVQ